MPFPQINSLLRGLSQSRRGDRRGMRQLQFLLVILEVRVLIRRHLTKSGERYRWPFRLIWWDREVTFAIHPSLPHLHFWNLCAWFLSVVLVVSDRNSNRKFFKSEFIVPTLKSWGRHGLIQGLKNAIRNLSEIWGNGSWHLETRWPLQ